MTLEITVGDSLTTELITRNTGEQTFNITQALHTYFKVGDIERVRVLGLENLKYIDKVDGGAEKRQNGVVTISEEVDRIYIDVPNELVIEDAAMNRRIEITSTGSKTAVVWNPWAENSAKMGDLKAEDYQSFICVETVNAAAEVIKISPGNEYRLQANYRIERD